MRYFPMFVDLTGRECLVVGATEEARRKAAVLRGAGASVRCRAELGGCPERWAADLALAVVATGDAAVDTAAAAVLKRLRVPINVVDRPDLCSFIWPAIVNRDPVTIAVSTGGASPLLARLIRARIERAVPAAFGPLAALVGSVRKIVRRRVPDLAQRRRFWQEILTGRVAALVFAGRLPDATAALYRVLASVGR